MDSSGLSDQGQEAGKTWQAGGQWAKNESCVRMYLTHSPTLFHLLELLADMSEYSRELFVTITSAIPRAFMFSFTWRLALCQQYLKVSCFIKLAPAVLFEEYFHFLVVEHSDATLSLRVGVSAWAPQKAKK